MWRAVGQRRARSRSSAPSPFPSMLHLDRQRGAREARPDRGGGVGAGRAVGQLERAFRRGV